MRGEENLGGGFGDVSVQFVRSACDEIRKRQLHSALERVIAVLSRSPSLSSLTMIRLLVARDCELTFEVEKRETNGLRDDRDREAVRVVALLDSTITLPATLTAAA